MLPTPCINALLALYPQYFSMTADEQTLWRAELASKHYNLYSALQLHMLIHGYGMKEKKAKKRLKGKGKHRLKSKPQAWLNLHTCYLAGIGEDSFYLNEHMSDEVTLLNYPTLYDYDIEDFRFQESARERDFNIEPQKTFVGSLSGMWARAITDNNLTYLNISMVSSHVYYALENLESDLLNEHIPHKYVEGPDHMSSDKKGYVRWDMHIDANGKEALYEAMRAACRTYLRDRTDALGLEMDRKAQNTVWFVPTTDPFDGKDDINYSVIFSDKTAIKVRFTHFMRDCKEKLGDNADLQKLVNAETNAFTDWFFKTLKEKETVIPEKSPQS